MIVILSFSSLRLASFLQIVLHQWRNGKRWRSIGHDKTDNPLYIAFKKIVYSIHYSAENLDLRFLLTSLLLIQITDIFRINGHNVLSSFMYLHCPLYFCEYSYLNFMIKNSVSSHLSGHNPFFGLPILMLSISFSMEGLLPFG